MEEDKKKSIKILVVEDDEASSTIVVRFLNQMGFSRIVSAVNGNEALNKLYLNQVDLIVSDWRMPDMDGLEFYKKAKQENLLEDIPFLMVSAENEKSKVAEALRAGVRDYILKPVDFKILEGKVEKLLNLEK
jgi:CheY-like chemotaxis protein